MTPIFPDLPADLGVYTLTRLLGSHATCDRYIARQSHVDRSVVIEVLRPDSPKEILDAFLRTARVRVAAKVPHVSQVLETMVSGNVWYITSECPAGVPLSQMIEENRHLGTIESCTVIQRIGELYDHCARNSLATEVITPDAIFVTDGGDVTFLSPLVSGTPGPEAHVQQLDALADTLRDIRPEGEAGQTRVATLLEWLGLEFDGQRMEWQAVASTAEYIKDNVASPPSQDKARERTAESAYTRKRRFRQYRRNILRYGLVASGCLLCAGAISLLGFVISPLLPGVRGDQEMADYVYCRTREGQLSVMSMPVSISQYRDFLEAYAKMPAKKRASINKGAPDSAADHTPAEWQRQLRAAEGNGTWYGEFLTENSPVLGVSYWDALAYANYRGATLPSADVLHTIRKVAGVPDCDEWTSTVRDIGVIYDRATLVLPGKGSDTPGAESDLSHKKLGCSFRLVFPTPRQKS